MNVTKDQSGYSYEFPILFLAIVFTLLFVVPHLSAIGRKILVIVGAVAVLWPLHYMIVTPGWQGNARRLEPAASKVVFGLIAILLILGAIVYAVKG